MCECVNVQGSERMLEKSKSNMKRDLESSLESYNTMVRIKRDECH